MAICRETLCTGCFSCMSICPTNAISVKSDVYGKTIPSIDQTKCIECGACVRSCPINKEIDCYMPMYAAAAWSKTKRDVAKSSSGGVGTVFARQIIIGGGVVYGAASVNRVVKCIRVDDLKDLDLLRGSKYVQSYTGTIFQQVKRDLAKGTTVLFIGVPCQIAGLRTYLKGDYENLFTVDLICHGTPPFQYLKEHVDQHVALPWDSVSFRGERDWFLSVYGQSELLYSNYKDYDLYFKAFLERLSFRDNCYQCPYAQPKRCADITMGDFWGIDRTAMRHPYDGKISLVLINTPRGEQLWNQCETELVWEERPMEEAVNPTQGNLLHPSVPHEERELFLRNYPTLGFEGAVSATKLAKKVKWEKRKTFIYRSRVIRILRKVKRTLMG